MDDQDVDQQKGMQEPLLNKPSNHKGGFRTLPFIIVHEGLERAAFSGLQPNMIVYLMGAYGLDMATGSNILFYWAAASSSAPLLGAILGDSCVRRFWVIAFGSISSLLGVMLLWSTTIIPGARPQGPQYGKTEMNSTSATPFQLAYLSLSLGLMSIGSGGIRSSTLAFGADQLTRAGDEQNEQRDCSEALQSLFNWYYLVLTTSSLISMTCIVYIQDHMGWQVGFGIPVSLMLLSSIAFFSASPLYVKRKPTASLFTGFAQVVVAAWKNRHLDFSSHVSSESLYYVKKGSMIKAPSEKLRCLNKACIVKDHTQDLTPDETAIDPWRLCTTDQVEEFKSIVNIVPLWSTGILAGLAAFQSSLLVVQARSMDRHVFTPGFEIPAGSFTIFAVISLILWLVFYNHIFIPLASRALGKPVSIDNKTRMGFGILLSCCCMAVAAVVESVRRGRALAGVSMSAMWLVPQVCILGLADGLIVLAQIEFFYSECPKSMSSISSNLYGVSVSIGSLVSSAVMSIVNHVTAAGGKDSWVASDPNKGHYDYYYWVIGALSLLNYLYFLICSRAHNKEMRDSHETGEQGR